MRNIRDKIFEIEKELEKLKESYNHIDDKSLRDAIHIRLNEIKIEFMRLNQHYYEPAEKKPKNKGKTDKEKTSNIKEERLENLRNTIHDGLLFVKDTSHLMTTEIKQHLPTQLKHKVDHAEDRFFKTVTKTEERISSLMGLLQDDPFG